MSRGNFTQGVKLFVRTREMKREQIHTMKLLTSRNAAHHQSINQIVTRVKTKLIRSAPAVED